MDYPFENLSPEKFQPFCQALLVNEYPGVQCLPVAQPDAGRDAIQYLMHPTRTSQFVVFQVKYCRKPLAEADPHKWLEGIVEQEAPKIKKLIPQGAKEFILMTNVPGTAHPKSGTIDSVNTTLRKELGIPSICWWRNDLSRRLDNAWDIKWVYPELMTGPDLLRALIESGPPRLSHVFSPM
jgi:hypothetical protein